jgi:hypothetical protein
VMFEFEKDSNSNSKLKLLSTSSKALSLVLGRIPTLLHTRRPSPAATAAQLTGTPSLTYLSLTCGTGLSAAPPSLLPHFSPSLLPTAPRRPVPCARDGMAGDEMARTSRPAHARAAWSRDSAKGK